MKDIGARLKELRTNQGLTQQRVAELTGLARTNIVMPFSYGHQAYPP